MTQQTRFDVLGPERLSQERVVEQIDLPDRQVVRRPPPAVDRLEFRIERFVRPAGSVLRRRHGSVNGRPAGAIRPHCLPTVHRPEYSASAPAGGQ
jgi:hypothetical protein